MSEKELEISLITPRTSGKPGKPLYEISDNKIADAGTGENITKFGMLFTLYVLEY